MVEVVGRELRPLADKHTSRWASSPGIVRSASSPGIVRLVQTLLPGRVSALPFNESKGVIHRKCLLYLTFQDTTQFQFNMQLLLQFFLFPELRVLKVSSIWTPRWREMSKGKSLSRQPLWVTLWLPCVLLPGSDGLLAQTLGKGQRKLGATIEALPSLWILVTLSGLLISSSHKEKSVA